MKQYNIKITATGRHSMNTLLTNLETGYSYEEKWYLEDGCWVWEDGWSTDGGNQPGLFWTLNENDALTDEYLNLLARSFCGQFVFEA